MQVLQNWSYYTNSIDYLVIIGEVQNNTSDYLEFVRVAANLFNGSGILVGTDFTYTTLDVLAPGDKTCFTLLLEEPANWSYVEFEAPTYWTDADPLPAMTIIRGLEGYDSGFDWYRIIGQIRNDSANNLEFVKAVATAYDGSGRVVDCDFTYVNADVLAPGAASSFDLVMFGDLSSDIATVRLQADGNRQSQ